MGCGESGLSLGRSMWAGLRRSNERRCVPGPCCEGHNSFLNALPLHMVHHNKVAEGYGLHWKEHDEQGCWSDDEMGWVSSVEMAGNAWTTTSQVLGAGELWSEGI